MNVVVTGGEQMNQPIGNKGFYVTSERSQLVSVPTWLHRHGLERRGLSLLAILKKVVFTHSCAGRNGVESMYCKVPHLFPQPHFLRSF